MRRLAFWAAAASVLTTADHAAAQPNLEYEVKAAFLLNFTKFIEWPPNAFAAADSPFSICILGKDPFGRALDDTVKGEAVNGRKLLVRRLTAAPAPQSCQIAFIDTTEKALAKDVTAIGPGVLTVSDGDRFIDDGGMIAFVLDNRRVRFDINQSAAQAAGLKLSSRLLSVARSVKGGR